MRWLITMLLSLAALALSSGVQAHEGRPIYIEVTEGADTNVRLRWRIPPVMAAGDMPMIRLSGANCLFAAGMPRPSLVGEHLYRCTARPESVEIRFPRANPVLSTLVVFSRENGTTHHIMAPPDKAVIPLPQKQDFLQVASGYLVAGTNHILEGYDHLLFVLCLMLIARSSRRVVLTVTGFTIGHSITLGMSVLGHWSLPAAFVEPLITFSIFLLAAEALRNNPQTLTNRYPAFVATAFGLLHGLGFAGALSEIGLPETLQLPALLFFNLGVEAGQLIFVVCTYIGLRLVRFGLPSGTLEPTPAPIWRAMLLYPAGIVSAYWTIERLAGL